MANIRIAIYDSPLGPGFSPLVWKDAIMGYVVVPDGSFLDAEGVLHVPGDPRPYDAAELASAADAHFRGFGWISAESMAA